MRSRPAGGSVDWVALAAICLTLTSFTAVGYDANAAPRVDLSPPFWHGTCVHQGAELGPTDLVGDPLFNTLARGASDEL